MLLSWFPDNSHIIIFSGIIFSFIATIYAFTGLRNLLPRDRGRAFAVQGEKSKGKHTGGGLFFILIFILGALLILPLHMENLLYYFCIVAAMITGFLDDRAVKAWSEYKKGILDLAISAGVGITFTYFQGSQISLPLFHTVLDVPAPLFACIAALIVWVSINAFNCTDGVDGLSSSLFMVTTFSYVVYMSLFMQIQTEWTTGALLMMVILSVYLWFNTYPASVQMGDAGSRGLGVFLAILVLQSGNPLSMLFFCLLILLDGMSGILKITLKRFFKISILKNITTPFHDHFRKKAGWENPQVTVRFTLVNIVICSLYLTLLYLFS